LSTTTAPEAASEAGTRTQLIDADGHVLEDIAAIVQRLPARFRRQQERQGAAVLSKVANMTAFPPLGYLSSISSSGAAKKGPEESGANPDSWQFFLDAMSIERTVLYPTAGLAMGRVRDLDYAVATSRAYNDWMAEVYLGHSSGRFQAAALLPMQVPSAAAAEVRRAVDELGFSSVVIPAHGLPNHAGSEQYFDVFEVAESLDVGVALHGGVYDGMGFDDFNVFAAVQALGHPMALLISLGGMLFNRVFERFPKLRVAYLEGGAAWTLMAAERFSESYSAFKPLESERVLHLEDGTSVRDYLRELVQSGRLVFGCEGGEDQLAPAIDYFGCAPFMYSSDFPHAEASVEACTHELAELGELPLAEETKQLVRAGTAVQFYKF
jgi:hypothetical protein